MFGHNTASCNTRNQSVKKVQVVEPNSKRIMTQENGQIAGQHSVQPTVAEWIEQDAMEKPLNAAGDAQNVELQINSNNRHHIEQNEGQFTELNQGWMVHQMFLL
ncbi:Hypothetical predicted protein [Olea europaea subsp. europaea]|uniref:Uncharacterized protein n=1 Tax=Olea europaea subsp. europaea TaxID=158383 RepID=A0A8S0RT58_OLEEU|nr:Hypothetical predicted protein [Olea europaea subsp. europaea]